MSKKEITIETCNGFSTCSRVNVLNVVTMVIFLPIMLTITDLPLAGALLAVCIAGVLFHASRYYPLFIVDVLLQATFALMLFMRACPNPHPFIQWFIIFIKLFYIGILGVYMTVSDERKRWIKEKCSMNVLTMLTTVCYGVLLWCTYERFSKVTWIILGVTVCVLVMCVLYERHIHVLWPVIHIMGPILLFTILRDLDLTHV